MGVGLIAGRLRSALGASEAISLYCRSRREIHIFHYAKTHLTFRMV